MSSGGESQSLPFGPMQLLVLGFDRTQFDGQVMPELERLKEAGIVRLVDLLFVRKEGGEIQTMQASDLSTEEAEEMGALVGALLGVGMGADEEGLADAMALGAAEGADGHLLDESNVWFLEDAIPDGTSVAIALIEHRWAIPLRDKLAANDAVVLADEWVHPKDLIALGERAMQKAATS